LDIDFVFDAFASFPYHKNEAQLRKTPIKWKFPSLCSWQLIMALASLVALARSFGSGPHIKSLTLSVALYASQFPCPTDYGPSLLANASQFASAFISQEHLVPIRADKDAEAAFVIELAFHGMQRSETAE
jgi:hypothetical protein